ncbi:beta-glucoside-specific PTS transporter subunit IIABC [Terrisporobacter mayombei]|uniref:beta-glucoside-specific PTS transporter subunit IIABC n=1 Tax=Terrisporobacter mayombei TaxID=1541 RepID=UPI00093CDF13|nr:beta-glucoside-specific PTS transporter subunit IIABC [Terrisporobacter mayombei]MCC3670198.1 beta-glucoside-specific PTS transporter subunit IIABC [Terrisporobacter mayombei]
MGKYSKLAEDIIKNVGGKENIIDLKHCITRLRFNLKDESIANDDILKNMDGVITVMKSMGQYMVVIGEHVPHVYTEVCEKIGMKPYGGQEGEEAKEKKSSLFNRVLNVVMGGMGPCLNMICASGIVKGVTTLLTVSGIIKPEDGIYLLLTAIGDAIFFYLPLMLGQNVAKKLEMDPFLGFLIGAIMCYPAINGVDINLFGHVFNATYTGSFLPVVFMIAAAAPLERFFKKYVPDLVSNFIVPVLVLIIVIPIGFVLIGPVANLIGVGINYGMNSLIEVSPLIAGTLLAGFYQVFVLFGVSGVLYMFPFMDLMQGIPSQLMAYTYFACFAQIGVVLAIYLKTKDKKLKSIALPAFISGIFGVTEPAIYGVTLPRIKMFVVSCIGSATAGIVVYFANIMMYTYAGMGVIGLLGLLNPKGPEILPLVIATVVPFVFSFVVAYLTYKDDEVEAKIETKVDGKVEKTGKETVFAPIKGEVAPLKESADAAFACEALGKGIVIKAEEGKVVAPFDGVVRTLFPTKHAIGIASDNGCEMLIHVGYNTVQLEGKYFESFVTQGDTVKKGDLLVSFDINQIKEEGYSIETPVVITNTDNYLDIIETKNKSVEAGEELLTVIH